MDRPRKHVSVSYYADLVEQVLAMGYTPSQLFAYAVDLVIASQLDGTYTKEELNVIITKARKQVAQSSAIATAAEIKLRQLEEGDPEYDENVVEAEIIVEKENLILAVQEARETLPEEIFTKRRALMTRRDSEALALAQEICDKDCSKQLGAAELIKFLKDKPAYELRSMEEIREYIEEKIQIPG